MSRFRSVSLLLAVLCLAMSASACGSSVLHLKGEETMTTQFGQIRVIPSERLQIIAGILTRASAPDQSLKRHFATFIWEGGSADVADQCLMSDDDKIVSVGLPISPYKSLSTSAIALILAKGIILAQHNKGEVLKDKGILAQLDLLRRANYNVDTAIDEVCKKGIFGWEDCLLYSVATIGHKG